MGTLHHTGSLHSPLSNALVALPASDADERRYAREEDVEVVVV
jgi:hypothetical protein